MTEQPVPEEEPTPRGPWPPREDDPEVWTDDTWADQTQSREQPWG